MSWCFLNRRVQIFIIFTLMCSAALAHADMFSQAKALQREGRYDEAIETFKDCLAQPVKGSELTDQ
jgi:hypothetical protein